MKELEWNVFYIDFSTGEVGVFNVFHHSRFHQDVEKTLKKCSTREEFEKELRASLIHYFWAKYEWEVLISPLSERKEKVQKVDVFRQIDNNWNVFADYVWNAKIRK